MVSGLLALKVLKIEGLQHVHTVEEGLHYAVRIRTGNHEQRTKYKGHADSIDQTLHFEIHDGSKDDEVNIEILHEGRKKAITNLKMKLGQFVNDNATYSHELTFKNGAKTELESTWKASKANGTHSAEHVKAPEAVVVSPSKTLTVHETHRPWFFRASYYYDTTKNVYSYTTSFRVISSVARFGENTTNAVLEKILGKNLGQLDQSLVAPTLTTLDNKVDETISTVLVKLIEGQNYVLQKKNDVVDTASTVAKKSTEKISDVVGTTLETAVKAKDYTTEQIKSVTYSAYDTVVSAKDYTTSQVANVSSSAYGRVKSVTVSVASYVPILGAKIHA